MIPVHVNSGLISAHCNVMVMLKAAIVACYAITNLGTACWFLSFELKHNRSTCTISISQVLYIDQLIERFGMQKAKPVAVPMNPHANLSQMKATKDKRKDMRRVPYAELVSALNWILVISRPDNQFATLILLRFMANPACTHWEAAKYNLHYLMGTKHHKLVLNCTLSNSLKPYSNCNWALLADQQLISRCAILLSSTAISWYLCKQSIVTQSTCKAEYIGMSKASCKLTHIALVLHQLPFCKFDRPLTLYGNNQSAIQLAKSGNFSAWTKHIDVKYQYITKALEDSRLCLQYTPTNNMVANIFTKALPCEKLKYFCHLLGVCPA